MDSRASNLAAILPAVGTNLVVQERPIPTPGHGEIVIRNHAVALNPLDWKRQASGFLISSYPTVLGEDVAGIVEKVDPSVTAFKPGDRVSGVGHGYISGNPDNGGFQTYTAVQASTVTLLPDNSSFLQGVTIPSAVGTSAIALVDVLGFSLPGWKTQSATSESQSILVWGGASSVGAQAIQLARLAGLTVFATASDRHHAKLRELGASFVVDYKSPTVVADLLAASKQARKPILYALDAVSTEQSLALTAEVLEKSIRDGEVAKLAHTLPANIDVAGVELGRVVSQDLWGKSRDFSAWLFNQALPRWVRAGTIVPSAYQVVEGGLGGIQSGLQALKKGASGE